MRFAFVGDLALGDHPKTVGFGFRSRYPEGIPAHFAERLLPIGDRPALVFGNLEFPLHGTAADFTGAVSERQCRGIAQYAEFLASAGFSTVNVANNHSAQHGHAAFHATVDLVRGSGIAVTGTPDDFTDDTIIEADGCRVAVLGWSDRPRQYDSAEPPYNEFSDEAFERIRDARRRADLVIVSIHWGAEFVQIPSERERRVARTMIDHGARIVVGHHPHVLREVEAYQDGLIAYSLGNHVGDMVWNPDNRRGACLLVDCDGPRVRGHRLALSWIESDYFPRYLSTEDAEQANRRIERIRQRQGRQAERRGYHVVVARQERRHVWLTAAMMARSLHRYPADVRRPLVLGPFENRLRRLTGRA